MKQSDVDPLRDLGMLKRDRALQRRYDEWAKGIKAEYGSMGEHSLETPHSVRYPTMHLSHSELPPDLPSSVGETRYSIKVEEPTGPSIGRLNFIAHSVSTRRNALPAAHSAWRTDPLYRGYFTATHIHNPK